MSSLRLHDEQLEARDYVVAEHPPSALAVVECMPTFTAFDRMGAIPRRWLPRLRRLSVGSEEGAMVRWSYHDGSTWAMVLFEGFRRDPNAIVGWSVFTLQEAAHPIVGVYVDERRRCQGYGTLLVSGLLEKCRELVPAGRIYAVADWWPKYIELITAAGCKHLEWD